MDDEVELFDSSPMAASQSPIGSYCPESGDSTSRTSDGDLNETDYDLAHPNSPPPGGDGDHPPPTVLVAMSYTLAGPILLILIIFGLWGNLICLYVLSRPKRRPRVNVYLLTLAVWDWILVASSFFVYNLPVLAGGSGANVWDWTHYVRALPYLYAMAAMSHNCSIWIVVSLAVERYFALCHPLKHRLWWTGSSLRKILLIAISVTGVLYSLPRLFETRIVECVDRDTGNTVLSIGESRLQNNTHYRLWYKTIGGMALFSVVPTCILLVLSIRVAVAMKIRDTALEGLATATCAKRKSTPKGSFLIEYTAETRCGSGDSSASSRGGGVTVDSPYNTNTMLIVVVVKFLFCHSLPAVLDVCESTMGTGFHQNYYIDLLIDLSNVLVVLNSSCNVLIYYFCSQRFRYEIGSRTEILVRKCFVARWSMIPGGGEDILLNHHEHVAANSAETV